MHISYYKVLHTDSNTCADGVCLYIKDTIKFRLRNDLLLKLKHCEDLWLELEGKGSNLIVAVIYCHPNQDMLSFQDKLCENLNNIENKKLNYIVSGNININTLDKSISKIKNYFNKLRSIGCKLLINNPTRYADNCKSTLLDHIYSNITKRPSKSGVRIFEILNHLLVVFAIFCIVKNARCLSDAKTKLIRNARHFSLETFLIDLDNELFSLSQNSLSETNTASVNQDATNLVDMFNSIIDKHAPLRPMSRQENRLSEKTLDYSWYSYIYKNQK